MKNYILIFLLFLMQVGNLQGQSELRFLNDKFKIAQFTDLHLIGGDAYRKNNDSTIVLVKTIIDNEKPDLVIFTGDIVVSSEGEKLWKELLKPVVKSNVPFIITFGNHDIEADISKQKVLELVQTMPNNLTFNADNSLDGVGNCNFAVKSSDGKSYKWILYVFDSHAYPKDKSLGTYDWIKHNQIQWYRLLSQAYTKKNGEALPSLAFFHIPLPEYAYVKEQRAAVGNKIEDVCSPRLNSGLFTAFVEQGDVKGMFVGHDHNNDFAGVLNNICLAYGRKTGYNSAYNEVLSRGARIIELYPSGHRFDTYIRTLKGKEFPITHSW